MTLIFLLKRLQHRLFIQQKSTFHSSTRKMVLSRVVSLDTLNKTLHFFPMSHWKTFFNNCVQSK